MALPAVLPSVTCHGVGTLIAIISQLNTLPACAPVNASMATLRLATHDSGSGWFANPFLCDSFIHDSTPVYPGARHGLLGVPGPAIPPSEAAGRCDRTHCDTRRHAAMAPYRTPCHVSFASRVRDLFRQKHP